MKAIPNDPFAAPEKPTALLRGANVAAFCFTLATNGTAGKAVGNVSRKYANRITPDGWAFSIWGIIYCLVLAFLVYQAKCATPRSADIVNRIGWWFVASCLCNGGWILIWTQGTPVTAVISSVMLLGLVGCCSVIGWKSGAWQPADAPNRTWWDIILVDVTFSIYGGWCTVAAIVNTAAAGVACGWGDDFLITGSQWGAVMIVVAGVVNLAVLATRSDPVFPLVYLWACLAFTPRIRRIPWWQRQR